MASLYPFRLFGFRIGRELSDEADQRIKNSMAVPSLDDGSVIIQTGTGAITGAYTSLISFDHVITNEQDLIRNYRDISLQSDIDLAIDDIVNEAIVCDENRPVITVNTDAVPFSDDIKQKIQKEFEEILNLLNFRRKGYDIFKRWYIDGRLYYHIILNPERVTDGIVELRQIDPRFIRKITEVRKEKDPKTGVDIVVETKEYYAYNPLGINSMGGYLGVGTSTTTMTGVKISSDSVCYCHSGLIDPGTFQVLSYLHKAIKPFNQLRMIEDAVVIYRITRAPERRVFYVDVGNLPKNKAEAYVEGIMTKFKNKITYDQNTGDIRDDRRNSTITEDFWLPRREGGKGTEVTTLQGGQNLGEMEDVEYFRKKLYKALNIPRSRLEQEKAYTLGRATEITRDEVKFSKYINRLRVRFSIMFDQLLKVQLIAKNICSEQDWEEKIHANIGYDFQSDSYFAELKELEIMSNRVDLVDKMSQYVGKYFSDKYIRKHILRQNDLDMQQMDDEMQEAPAKTEPGSEGEQNPDQAATPEPSAEVPAEEPPTEEQ